MTSFLTVPDFSLRHTMRSGQFFRWRERDGLYQICQRNRIFRVWQEDDRLCFTGVSAAYLRTFFSLDHDLAGIARSIDRDPWMHEALRRYWGLRLLRQDPWECTAAFLTSIACTIPRITRNLAAIAETFGEEIRSGGLSDRRFPTPEEMGGEERLRRLGLGFRARYLADAARLCRAGILEDLPFLSMAEAREALMVVQGIAEKVADCILLFAFNHPSSFPVDTWIRKVMSLLYFSGRRATDREIREFAGTHFGRYAGYAQQYLYVYARDCWSEIEQKALLRSIVRRRLPTRRPAATPSALESLLREGAPV